MKESQEYQRGDSGSRDQTVKEICKCCTLHFEDGGRALSQGMWATLRSWKQIPC